MNGINAPLFDVWDEYELLALWRLIAEAKFQSDPDDTDLWGSPGVDISAYSQTQLNEVARKLNERPRKTLEYQTPADRFSQLVASTG